MKREVDGGVNGKDWSLERQEKMEGERELSELSPRSGRVIVVKEEWRLWNG